MRHAAGCPRYQPGAAGHILWSGIWPCLPAALPLALTSSSSGKAPCMRALQRGFPPPSCGRRYLAAGRRPEHRSAAQQRQQTARPAAERGRCGRPTAGAALPPAQPRRPQPSLPTSPAGRLSPGTGTVPPGTPSNPTSPAERKSDGCEMRAWPLVHNTQISAVQDAFPKTKWCLLPPGRGSRVGKSESTSAKHRGGAQDPL